MEWWVVIKSQRKVTGPCVSKTWALGCSWLCNRMSMVKGYSPWKRVDTMLVSVVVFSQWTSQTQELAIEQPVTMTGLSTKTPMWELRCGALGVCKEEESFRDKQMSARVNRVRWISPFGPWHYSGQWPTLTSSWLLLCKDKFTSNRVETQVIYWLYYELQSSFLVIISWHNKKFKVTAFHHALSESLDLQFREWRPQAVFMKNKQDKKNATFLQIFYFNAEW